MTTERYTVTFFGIESKYYTDDYVAYLWERNANKEFKNSGIFVTAQLDIKKYICGEASGCTLGETTHVLTIIRNPAVELQDEIFYNSFINVVNDTRHDLGNPTMTIVIERIQYFYFAQS